MSDLTWTEMPEVSPEQPDELVLDFSGEIYRVAPADTFVIGRGGDLDIDDNPYLHRRFLVFAHSENLWWIANEGSRLSATLTDGEGLVQSRLAPGARMPLVFPRVILTFSAGPTTYEINLITSGEDRFSGIDGVRQSSGQTTIGVTPMTRSQLLLVLALSEPVLKRAGTGAAARSSAGWGCAGCAAAAWPEPPPTGVLPWWSTPCPPSWSPPRTSTCLTRSWPPTRPPQTRRLSAR